MISERRKRILITCTSITLGIFFIFIIFSSSTKLIPNRICKTFGDLIHIEQPKGNLTCFPRYTQGPCPTDMILIPLPNNHSVGVCQCDNMRNRRALVYHKGTNKCYFVFTRQRFCKQDEWVTFSPDHDGSAICTPNICLNHILTEVNDLPGEKNPPELVPLTDGSCAILGARHESCPKEGHEVIRFFQSKLFPACTYQEKFKRLRTMFAGMGVPHTECPEGFYKTELGLCAVEFDDS